MTFDESFLGYGVYTLDEFEFVNGKVLKDVSIECFISGTPKYDDEGNIVNVVIYCHSYNGNCFSINDLYQITAESAPFDKNEYLIISITSLGFPESCSPSTTGLKLNFPKYSVLDSVNFKRQFLKEFLDIEKVMGVTGRGIGGYEVYTWACEYPDEMEFIMICDSSFKTNGYRYAISRAVDSIIESSEGFYSETYDVSLSNTMISINRLIYSNIFSKKILQQMSNDEIDILMDEFVENGLFLDIYDLKYRNDLVLEYNVEDKLQNIEAETLIFGHIDDLYYSHEYDTLPADGLIKNSEVLLFESLKNPTGYEDFTVLSEAFEKFLKKLENKKNKS